MARYEVQVPLGVGVHQSHTRLAQVGIDHRLTTHGHGVGAIHRAASG